MSGVLLLIDHKENRRILAEWLVQRVSVILPVSGQEFSQDFDLAIIDGTALDRLWNELRQRKEAVQPTFLPVLFITGRQDVSMITRHLWQSVDELILTPIEKLELLVRVEVLVRARRLSLELEEANRQLSDRIDQHQQTEKTLLNANRRFDRAAQVVNGIIYDWDLQENSIELSQQAETVLGYNPQEITTNPDWLHSLIHFDDFPEAIQCFQSILVHNNEFSVEYRIRHKDGHYLHIWDRATVIRDNDGLPLRIIGFMLDITERKRADEERAELLRRERRARERAEKAMTQLNHLQRLTSQMTSALIPAQVAEIIVDQGKEVLQACAGRLVLLSIHETLEVVRSVGYAGDETALPMPQKGPLADVFQNYRSIWIPSSTHWTRLYGELPAPVGEAWIATALIVNGELRGGIEFAFKDAQAFEDEIREFVDNLAQLCSRALERTQLYESERQARAEAEEANRMKLSFFAMISHELRTPLTSIKGFSTTLLADDVQWDNEMERSFLNIINEESDKMHNLVEQLLDLSQIAAGMFSIHLESHPIQDVFERCAAEFDTLTMHHQFSIYLPSDLPMVDIDVQRVGQVMVNLIGNAAKFSLPGTVIDVKVTANHENIQIAVSDEGPGIPKEYQTTIFEAFRQLDSKPQPISPSRKRSGVGLGLAICKGIVEAHEGHIWVLDSPLPGATIAFTLPVSTQP